MSGCAAAIWKGREHENLCDSGGLLSLCDRRRLQLGSSVYAGHAPARISWFGRGADAKNRGKFKYELPDNVVEVREIFLDEALSLRQGKGHHRFSPEEIQTLREFINCGNPGWDSFFRCIRRSRSHRWTF